MYVAIKLHKSEVPYPISTEYVIQIHDVSPDEYDEEVGIGSYDIIATKEINN